MHRSTQPTMAQLARIQTENHRLREGQARLAQRVAERGAPWELEFRYTLGS